MSLHAGVYPSALLALALLSGCQTNGAAEPPAQRNEFAREDHGKSLAPMANGRVECAGECRVELFDGTALTRLVVEAGGAVQVPAQAGVVFVSAPGQIPEVKFVGADRPLGTVRLEDAPDPRRGGYLAVVTMKVVTGGKRGGGTQLVPVAGAELGLLLGRARSVLVTGEDGVLVTHMPANTYGIFTGGERHPVQVPLGGTAVLPLVMGTIRVD